MFNLEVGSLKGSENPFHNGDGVGGPKADSLWLTCVHLSPLSLPGVGSRWPSNKACGAQRPTPHPAKFWNLEHTQTGNGAVHASFLQVPRIASKLQLLSIDASHRSAAPRWRRRANRFCFDSQHPRLFAESAQALRIHTRPPTSLQNKDRGPSDLIFKWHCSPGNCKMGMSQN